MASLVQAGDKLMKRPRDMRLDALRGLFLIIMAGVHVPTPISRAFHEPFGFIGAAEAFIFLSASLAGLVYGRAYWRSGWAEMSARVWKRARTVYLAHLLVLAPTAVLVWSVAWRLAPLANHFHDFLQHPWPSLALMPFLMHQPPLFDILPLYVIFLGATPLLLALARRHGWGPVLLVSATGWLLAQFRALNGGSANPAALLPLRWGSFNFAAWQFLWVSALALGETSTRRAGLKGKFRLAAGCGAGAVVLAGLLSRYGVLAVPVGLYTFMDKWSLGPLRMLNFFSWVILLLAWNPVLSPRLLAPTALLGRHSLVIFSCHLPLVMAAATVVQSWTFPAWVQTLIGLAVIAVLFAVAGWRERLLRGPAAAPARPGAAFHERRSNIQRSTFNVEPPTKTGSTLGVEC